MDKIRERSFIPMDYLPMYMKVADKENAGIIFPHTYINGEGIRCRHLSKFNTQVSVPNVNDLKKPCTACGKPEKIGIFGLVYCSCIRYPIEGKRR